MEDLNQKRPKLISIETAIKYAQASVYALQHSGSEITSKSVSKKLQKRGVILGYSRTSFIFIF